MTAFSEFKGLVQRLAGPDFGRSENDLSSRLCRVFEELELHTILDTTTGRDSRKRPDISVYVDGGTADLAGSAEVAVESKLPEEVPGNLIDALLLPPLWEGKFLPYCRAHISSLRWFCLTTFERFLFVPIDDETRAMLASGQDDADMYAAHIRATGIALDLRSTPHDLEIWIRNNLSPDALTPPPLSTVLDATAVANGSQLDDFADEMATTVAGRLGVEEPRSALIHSVRFDAERFEDLPNSAAASLMVFVLSQHPSMTPEGAREYLDANFSDQVDDFVSASIHSLIGRLFAYKVLEDAFCIGVSPPLLSPNKYVFHRTDYDALDAEELLESVFYRMQCLGSGTPQVIQNLAKTGAFFDWMKDRVDPQSFRRLFTLLATRSFRDLSGDLLGRFFEHYSQRIDSRRRRALGQYYTPHQVVSFMWHEPNNLSIEALELFGHFTSAGLSSEDFLLYCASIYNSDYAFEFLSENGGDTLPIPLNRPDRAVGVAAVARRLRDLTYLRAAFMSAEAINVSETPYDVAGLAAEAGFEERTVGGGRFQPDVTLVRRAGTVDTISDLIARGQDALNTEIATLFGLGAVAELE